MKYLGWIAAAAVAAISYGAFREPEPEPIYIAPVVPVQADTKPVPVEVKSTQTAKPAATTPKPEVKKVEYDPPAQTCCKVCSKGKACGNSCISRSYQCHQPPGCACDS